MKKVTLITFTVLLDVFLVATASALPKMFIPEEAFDFGYVPTNAKITHVFWLKSVGDDSLKIVKVVPG